MKDKFPPKKKIDLERALKESHAQREADEKDRRNMRGTYAPPIGKCRVCGGRVVGEIHYPDDGRIGGPPRQGYVGRWSCEACFLVYSRRPEHRPAPEKGDMQMVEFPELFDWHALFTPIFIEMLVGPVFGYKALRVFGLRVAVWAVWRPRP